MPEVESKTQGSRPRTQKKSEAKDKKIRGQGQPFREQTSRCQGQECSRPRTQAESVLKKKVFKEIFQAISKKKKTVSKNFFSGYLNNFNDSKNSAALESRKGQFSEFEAKPKDFKMCPRGLHLC